MGLNDKAAYDLGRSSSSMNCVQFRRTHIVIMDVFNKYCSKCHRFWVRCGECLHQT